MMLIHSVFIFNKHSNYMDIKEFILEYWKDLRYELTEGSKLETQGRHSWEFRLHRSSDIIAGGYIFETDGDNWYFQYPRNFEGFPGLFFQIRNDMYNPTEDDADKCEKWPEKILTSEQKLKILYFNMPTYFEYYSTEEELIKGIYYMKLENQSLDNWPGTLFEWNPTMLKITINETVLNSFKEKVHRFLNSEIANELLYIQRMGDGYLFISNPAAKKMGLQKDVDREDVVDLIQAFLYFEETENSA